MLSEYFFAKLLGPETDDVDSRGNEHAVPKTGGAQWGEQIALTFNYSDPIWDGFSWGINLSEVLNLSTNPIFVLQQKKPDIMCPSTIKTDVI